MDILLGQIVGSLPMGFAIIVFLLLLYEKINSMEKRLERMENHFIEHLNKK